MPNAVRVLLQAVLWLTLGGWVGAMLLFALGVARSVFDLLPMALAGQVVEAVLTPLQLSGAGAGVVLAGLALVMRRGRLLVAYPLVLSAVCLFNHFGITGAMEEVRDLAFEQGNAEAAARFGHLHGISMLLFSATLIGALGLAVLHARADLTRPKNAEIP